MRTINPETRETVTVNVIDGALAVTIVGGGGGSVTVDDITDAGATGKEVLKAATGPLARTALGMSTVGNAVAIAADAAAARTAIGAGTSSLAIGTTASTAMAGNKTLANIGGVVPAAGLPKAAAVADASSASSTVPGAVAADADLATVITALNEVITALTAVRSNSGSAVTQLNTLLAALRTTGYVTP